MGKASSLISLIEFEYRQLDDLLNTIKQLEPGEYDLSGVEAVLTTSRQRAEDSLNEVQAFITRYNKVCYILMEGFGKDAKSLILMSDEPRKLKEAKSFKDNGAVIYKDRLFAYNLG